MLANLLSRPLLLVILLTLLPASAFPKTLDLPPRPADAMTGSAFYEAVKNLSVTDREVLVYQQIAAGNVPAFMRNLIPIQITATVGGQQKTATIHVTPDYVAVGSDDDFFRMPMSGDLAQWVADLADCNLPTRKIVNAVYTAADVKLAPSFFNPDSYDIMSVDIFWQHNTRIETARAGNNLGLLVGGIKKDICVTPQLQNRPPPRRVAIYGWHQLNGTPIQPLSLVHGVTYMDYSHGARLVAQEMDIDGSARRVENVLVDAVEHVLLSDEGPLNRPDYDAGAPPDLPLELPVSDAFPQSGRQLPWTDRFSQNPVVSFSPAAPGGDGYVMLVRDPSGGIDTARLGGGLDTDYFVEADIYCLYRPELSSDGFDRAGIFLRDNGNGLFTGQSGGGIPGNCYGMAFQSDNGRVWCFKTVNGVLQDLAPEPIYRTSTAWRRMRVEARGETLAFRINDELLLRIDDATFARGQFGVGYQEIFSNNANLIGTRAENFKAGRPVSTSWLLR